MELSAFLREVESRTGAVFSSGAEALGVPPSAIELGGGKQIRPRLVYESALALNADMVRCVNIGTAAEMLHVASLCHDDVVDGADTRRGRPSLNARVGNHAAVLLGDYLHSTAALLAAKTLGLGVAELLAETVLKMSRAELMQPRLQWNLAADEETYRSVIEGKTAALFTACTGSTAIIAGAPENVRAALLNFGRGFGMAFQVLDDMLDYTPGSPSWGKEPLKDLKEGLVTLPMILALRSSNGLARSSVARYLESRGEVGLELEKTADYVKQSGALEKCSKIAQSFIDEASEALDGLVPAENLKTFARESLKRVF